MSKVERMVRNVIAMARGVLVLDENVYNLKEALEKEKIRVLKAPSNVDDAVIKEHSLAARIFVTNNSKHFIKDAVKMEYGIIATENVKSKDPEKLSKQISRAIINHNLWSKRDGFIVRLDERGSGKFEDLTGKSPKKAEALR
jgi:hypothetical protein